MLDTDFYDSALYYAEVWTHKVRGFVDGLASTDPLRRLKAVCDAGGYFRISRSLKKAYDVDIGLPRLEPVLDALDRVLPESVTDATLHSVIGELRREIGRAYGGRDLLSAATKFLWLRHRDIAVIYDSQARLALGAPSGDYGDYLERWRSNYSRVKPRVVDACERLLRARQPEDLVNAEVDAHGASEWFRRRVFDVYLWEKGARLLARDL
jgi:hypothetical protein